MRCSGRVYMCFFFFCFLMRRRPPRSTQSSSSAASDVYKRQVLESRGLPSGLDLLAGTCGGGRVSARHGPVSPHDRAEGQGAQTGAYQRRWPCPESGREIPQQTLENEDSHDSILCTGVHCPDILHFPFRSELRPRWPVPFPGSVSYTHLTLPTIYSV